MNELVEFAKRIHSRGMPDTLNTPTKEDYQAVLELSEYDIVVVLRELYHFMGYKKIQWTPVSFRKRYLSHPWELRVNDNIVGVILHFDSGFDIEHFDHQVVFPKFKTLHEAAKKLLDIELYGLEKRII